MTPELPRRAAAGLIELAWRRGRHCGFRWFDVDHAGNLPAAARRLLETGLADQVGVTVAGVDMPAGLPLDDGSTTPGTRRLGDIDYLDPDNP